MPFRISLRAMSRKLQSVDLAGQVRRGASTTAVMNSVLQGFMGLVMGIAALQKTVGGGCARASREWWASGPLWRKKVAAGDGSLPEPVIGRPV